MIFRYRKSWQEQWGSTRVVGLEALPCEGRLGEGWLVGAQQQHWHWQGNVGITAGLWTLCLEEGQDDVAWAVVFLKTVVPKILKRLKHFLLYLDLQLFVSILWKNVCKNTAGRNCLRKWPKQLMWGMSVSIIRLHLFHVTCLTGAVWRMRDYCIQNINSPSLKLSKTQLFFFPLLYLHQVSTESCEKQRLDLILLNYKLFFHYVSQHWSAPDSSQFLHVTYQLDSIWLEMELDVTKHRVEKPTT